MPAADGSGAGAELHPYEHHHRQVTSGGARAAVFGISDGLVTNVSLILGMAGAHPGAQVVRLAGLAGLVAGAFSMATGEYVSMRAQTELFERELARERLSLHQTPEGERRELTALYTSRGVAPELAEQLAEEMMRTPELALQTHAREELGFDPDSLGSPLVAALSSFVMFAVGALLPLIPWLVNRGNGALVASVVVGAVCSLGVGAALSLFTERPVVRSALRQLLLSGLAATVTFGIGRVVGVSGLG